ncbi:CUB and sushi domain-containing protein 2-like [Patiria miniata]|uniref:CUB domain-containing protein n=1 Tax=Patiria miniata TaxID=46514 RepID=A0A913ZKH1_PATMI|nr:CUB and sushi domain-containing protein 2-like [Patiria miniata]
MHLPSNAWTKFNPFRSGAGPCMSTFHKWSSSVSPLSTGSTVDTIENICKSAFFGGSNAASRHLFADDRAVTWLCEAAIVPCGKSNITLSNSTQTSETLTSPYYPKNYPNDARCIWFITVDEGSTIAFRFSVFNTERFYDTLTIGNGHESSDGDSVIGLWRGFLTNLSVVSNNHTAWMKFTSDYSVTEVGFEVKITQERPEGFCGKRNITLNNSTQTPETLTSPYYPNNYPNNARSIWFITVDEGSTIAFRFSVFNTQRRRDTLTIGNGHESSDSDSVIGLFSSFLTSLAVFSNNHTAWMEFTSDSSVTEVGFEVKITQERPEGSCGQDEFACQDESSGLICLARDDTCDGDGFTLCPDGSDESNCRSYEPDINFPFSSVQYITA